MKKLIVVLTFFVNIFNVYAFSSDLHVVKDGYLCTDNEIFPVYDIYNADSHYYFLNPENYYNFDMQDYEEISMSDTKYDESIRMYTSYNSLFQDSLYKNVFINKMLWENISNKTYFICDKDRNPINYDSSYDENYLLIKQLIEGPNIPEKLYVLPNQDFDLNIRNLAYYTSKGIANFKYMQTSENTYTLSGKKGQYDITVELKYNNKYGNLYTDNYNYLLKEGGYFNKSFTTHVVIDDPTLIIQNKSGEDINFSNLCFTLKNNKYSKDFCSNDKGVAEINVPMGVYYLIINSDINNDYNNSPITLNAYTKNLVINWGKDEEKEESSDIIEIIPSDTFELKGIIILILLSLGFIIVYKKLKAN